MHPKCLAQKILSTSSLFPVEIVGDMEILEKNAKNSPPFGMNKMKYKILLNICSVDVFM